MSTPAIPEKTVLPTAWAEYHIQSKPRQTLIQKLQVELTGSSLLPHVFKAMIFFFCSAPR